MDNVSIQSLLALCSGCGLDEEVLKEKLRNGEAFKYRGIGKKTHKKMCEYFGVEIHRALTPLQKKIRHAERCRKLHERKAREWRAYEKSLAETEVES